jgi:hypothetical protein
MTHEEMTPLRERMIPLGTLLRNTLPGSGRHAHIHLQGWPPPCGRGHFVVMEVSFRYSRPAQRV